VAAVLALVQSIAAAASEQAVAEVWFRRLTLREQAAQLIVIPFYGEALHPRSRLWLEFERRIRTLGVGGLVLLNRAQDGVVQYAEPYAVASFINRAQKLAKLPLIVAGDFERGASMRVAGATEFPHAMAYGAGGDTNATRRLGALTAREARALGVHWILAPVADVNVNPDNPVIHMRSYGEDPEAVSAHVSAYIEGAHSAKDARVLLTVKHFPGHGDTSVDSHLDLPVLAAARSRLDAVELVPFRGAVAARVDSIMSAHINVPTLEPKGVPATISSRILTDLIRKELGFGGLIATDALDMDGLTRYVSRAEAPVRALEAGADVLMAPPNPEEAVRAIVAAVSKGRLSRSRLRQSVMRVLSAKARLGLAEHRLVDIEAVADALKSPETIEEAETVAARAVTLIKNEGGVLPLARPEAACWIATAERRTSRYGRRFVEAVKQRAAKSFATIVYASTTSAEIDVLVETMKDCAAVVVNAGSISGEIPRLLSRVPQPLIFVAGNPYLLRDAGPAQVLMATFSTVQPAEAAGVKALFGQIAIAGRMPVTVPGIARRGEGISLTAGSGLR
jgi:beta-N-acetylhexosaminidase